MALKGKSGDLSMAEEVSLTEFVYGNFNNYEGRTAIVSAKYFLETSYNILLDSKALFPKLFRICYTVPTTTNATQTAPLLNAFL